jgi:TRAP-type C4-dicarboxylate transport system substrate-binding protein
VLLMAWERWQSLPEADKERYRRQAREYVQRGRTLAQRRRGR